MHVNGHHNGVGVLGGRAGESMLGATPTPTHCHIVNPSLQPSTAGEAATQTDHLPPVTTHKLRGREGVRVGVATWVGRRLSALPPHRCRHFGSQR